MYVVAQDVANVAAIGVEIEVDHRVEDLEALHQDGFDAVLVATGTPRAARLGVEGEDLAGVVPSLAFLQASKLGEGGDLKTKRVVVIGGGNVAMDVALLRAMSGAASVQQVCLEQREEMPAFSWEIDEALEEGVVVHNGWGVMAVLGLDAVQGIDLKKCTAVFDQAGRFSPSYDETVRKTIDCDVIIVAIGMGPDTATFGQTLPSRNGRTIEVDRKTLQSEVSYEFACGDAVTGATTITTAIGQGRRAAYMIDRWLQNEPFEVDGFDLRLPQVLPEDVLRRQVSHSRKDPVARTTRRSPASLRTFARSSRR